MAPIGLVNWAALYCCQINNHMSRESLKLRTPMEKSTGNTLDLSKFRFYFYKPLWYFEPKMKIPRPNLLKCRYLAIAESCGDAMTYYILTEPERHSSPRKVLMTSVIKSRQRNIGQATEYVNKESQYGCLTVSIDILFMLL